MTPAPPAATKEVFMNRIVLALSLASVACGTGILETALCSAESCAPCVTDADCGTTCSEEPESGSTCVDGICVTGCDCIEFCGQAGAICGRVDNGCGGTLDCGACPAVDTLDTACSDSQDCAIGQICDANGSCVTQPPACQSDVDCRVGFGCAPMGRCVSTCVEDVECIVPPGAPAGLTLVCREGLCLPGDPSVPGCISDADCSDNATCELGECVADDGCELDADCASEWVCIAAECVPPVPVCTTDDDCGVGEACAIIPGDCPDGSCASQCVPDLGACTSDADCPDTFCTPVGLCAPPCSVDADCLGDMTCTPAGVCMPPLESCATNADCNGDRLCDTFIGRCVSPCASSDDCVTPPSVPVTLVCDQTLGYCRPE